MPSKRPVQWLLGLAAVLSAAATPAATPFFLVDHQGGPGVLYRLEPSTGRVTIVGEVPNVPFGQVGGLAAASPNQLYVTTVAGWVLAVTVDPFSFTELGNIGGSLAGAAFSADGQLYAIDESTDELLRIQLAPTLARVVVDKVRLGSTDGSILDVDGADLVEGASGGWFLWTNMAQDLFALDAATAVATQLDPSNAGAGPRSGLAVDYQGGGTLYATAQLLDALLTVDPATGTTLAAVPLCLDCPTPYDHGFGDLASPPCVDADGDGFAAEGGRCGPTDCDDTAPDVYPGAPERCDGRDDDCDGSSDEEPEASATCRTACTATAQCVGGSCVTTPTVCDDGNPCTLDRCDPALGCQTETQPDLLSCSDGDACTGAEVCESGSCVDAPDLDCDDHNPCTVDTCTPLDGCGNTPVPGCCTTDADCADVSACTTNERCVGGQCLSDDVGCDDANPCTSDACDPASGCVNIAVVNGVACGDGDVCNGLETCQGGTCTSGAPLDCDDHNACTQDGCNPLAGCTRAQLPGCCASDADCADASACTINERCVGHACVSDPLACDDQNPCTSDGCNPATGCTFTAVPNGQSCSDVDFCNGIETCQAGHCAATAAPSCDDGNPCTRDACDGVAGCTHAPVGGCCFTDADCVDRDQCTVAERCVGGACTSEPRNCLDGNPCTVDACLPDVGCIHTPLVEATSCSDGAACDGIETCTAGTCRPGTPPDCDDANGCTADTCDNATGCRHAPIADCCMADADCADQDACTLNERCRADHTCASTTRVCDDGNVCSLDSCDPAAGCQAVAAAGGSCDDGQGCTTNDTCSAGVCAGVPLACDDGDLCNGEERCLAGAGTCGAPGDVPVCTPGSPQPTRTCLAELYVRNPGNRTGVRSAVQGCVQGDPSCDHDANPATCTFAVAVCLRVDDARFEACVPADVGSFTLLRPRAKSQPAEAAALLAAIAALPGATAGRALGRDVVFQPAITHTRCTGIVSLAVPVGHTLSYRGRALDVHGARDTDGVRLRCLGR